MCAAPGEENGAAWLEKHAKETHALVTHASETMHVRGIHVEMHVIWKHVNGEK